MDVEALYVTEVVGVCSRQSLMHSGKVRRRLPPKVVLRPISNAM